MEHGAGPMTTEIRCRGCATPLSVAEVLEHSSASWPNQRWLWFQCPRCGSGSHVEVRSDRLAFGDLDGAPGPAFLPVATHAADGLRCRPTRGGLRISFHGQAITIPVKR